MLAEVRPEVVVEVGTWKGASLVRMHGIARELGLGCQFVSVDTWLGSAEQWLGAKDRARLRLTGGYPDLFRQFVFNLVESGATDVFPLPMASSGAATVLLELGVRADLVYLDGSHSELDVATDLESYYALLTEDGVMFGDDYHSAWPGLVRSVDSFVHSRRLELEVEGPVWIARRVARDAADGRR